MVSGYAVVDVETTGLHPGWHHRVVEVAVVRIDRRGHIVDEWCTLLNPDRDLGPQHIHGITAAEVRRSPKFAEVAGDLAARLAGHVVVGHNVSFDLRFLVAEFARIGVHAPLAGDGGLCTMALSNRYLRSAARSLAMCCQAAGVTLTNAHSALYDARATAGLMAHFIRAAGSPEPWQDQWRQADQMNWPQLPTGGREVRRGTIMTHHSHFLARLVDGLPRVPHPPRADEYLAVLDRALLDRDLSATEQDDLVSVAQEMRLGRPDVLQLHHRYLQALANRAWSDELVTSAELADLHLVAKLLGLGQDEVGRALSAAPKAGGITQNKWGDFRLRSGDPVVFTGQMALPREVWAERALDAGLGVHDNVTKTTRLVVAADPDSLSGKAKKAHIYRIPIISEQTFAALLDRLGTQETS
ncbi:MAG: exonuclease domain-containing protein [Kibdelosporangium sp.]